MKKFRRILMISILALFFCNQSYGQINVLNRVKRVVNDRIEKQIDKTVNKQLDSIEKKVTDNEIKKIEKAVENKIEEVSVENQQQPVKITKATGKPTAISNAKAKGKYVLKSAIVEYKTTMMGFDAQQLLYFDNYGEKEANQTTMNVMGFKSNSIVINGENCVYTIDLIKRTAIKSSIDDKPSGIDFVRLTEEIQNEWKIKEEGNETVLEKNCIKYSMTSDKYGMNGFFWVWKGISLKSELNMVGSKILMEAVKIDENVSIPSDKFEIPGDVEIQEIE